MKRSAFSMIELVFVIVVLGILASVAVPRLAATRDDAQVAKGRSDVAAIRAAIVSERQGRLMRGESNYINRLNAAGVTTVLFDNNGSVDATLLQYGVTTKHNTNGYWDNSVGGSAAAGWTYVYRVLNTDTTFTYYPTTIGAHAAGTFTCVAGAGKCDELTR